MSEQPIFKPTINPDDHGAKVVLCGALLISPMAMMSAVNIYNRIRSKTLLEIDSILSLLTTVRLSKRLQNTCRIMQLTTVDRL